MIRLEPREIYDAAIIGQDGDRLVYCYDLLIDVLVESFQEDEEISKENAYYMAVDHICFNIEGMRPSYSNWPKIKRESDEQSEEE